MIRLLTAISLTFGIAACDSPSLPLVTPTPTCQIIPMPTGEHYFPAEFTVEPPA